MPPPDYSQRKDVRKAQKLAEAAESARIEYTRQIMATPLGREWMHTLLTRCHVFSTPFIRGAADLTAFNCGEQNIGYQTFADVVNHCPTEYVLMMQEANLKEMTNGRRQQPASTGERSEREDGNGRSEGPNELDPAVWSGESDELGPIGGSEREP